MAHVTPSDYAASVSVNDVAAPPVGDASISVVGDDAENGPEKEVKQETMNRKRKINLGSAQIVSTVNIKVKREDNTDVVKPYITVTGNDEM